MAQHTRVLLSFQLLKQLCLRFYLTGCLLILLIHDLNAQVVYKDIVYLKDGSIIKGQIIEFDSLDRLKVKTSSTDFFYIDKNNIRKFKINGQQSPSENTAFSKQEGFINVTQIGVLAGNSESNASVETYNGYRFNPYFSIGLTAGIDTYRKGLLIPVGIGAQGVFLDKKVSPIAFASAGKGLTWPSKLESREFKGGTYWNARIGIRVKNGANSAFTFQIGYNYQKSYWKSSFETWNGTENITIEKNTYRRTALMLGFSF